MALLVSKWGLENQSGLISVAEKVPDKMKIASSLYRSLWEILPALIMAVSLSGCAHTKTQSAGIDWRTANIHKVVVACVQGDRKTNRHIESEMLPKLRHQGFGAVAAQDLFPTTSEYSSKNLIDLMRRAQIDGIMEITYSGELSADGLPRQIKFKFHSIKNLTEESSDSRRPLDSALTILMGI